MCDCRREAIQVSLAGVRVEICAFGRADATLPQAYGRQAVQVRRLRALVRSLRPPGAAHEAPPAQGAQELALCSPCTRYNPATTSNIYEIDAFIVSCLFLSSAIEICPLLVNRFLFIFDTMTFIYIYN